MPTLDRDTILAWPKAELHCHLDGSLRLETMLDLAAKQDKLDVLPAEDVEGMGLELKKIDGSPTLEEYLRWFSYSIPLMQTREALHRIAYELAEDAANENVRYIEVRYGPILHTEEGLTMWQVNDAVLAGLADAERDHGIRSGIIVCGLRDRNQTTVVLCMLPIAFRSHNITSRVRIACQLLILLSNMRSSSPNTDVRPVALHGAVQVVAVAVIVTIVAAVVVAAAARTLPILRLSLSHSKLLVSRKGGQIHGPVCPCQGR